MLFFVVVFLFRPNSHKFGEMLLYTRSWYNKQIRCISITYLKSHLQWEMLQSHTTSVLFSRVHIKPSLFQMIFKSRQILMCFKLPTSLCKKKIHDINPFYDSMHVWGNLLTKLCVTKRVQFIWYSFIITK